MILTDIVFDIIKKIIETPRLITLSSNVLESLSNNNWLKNNYLYHYTNLEGFLGIVSSQNPGFWATHIAYMNDSMEYRHGIKLCEKIIEEFIKDSTVGVTLAGRDNLNTLKEYLTNDDDEVFVVSFCQNSDLLSQWRGYSRGQYGISIGFDFGHNQVFDTSNPINSILTPRPVIYDQENQIFRLKELIKDSIPFLNNIDSDSQIKQLSESLKYFIPVLKNSSFSEEEEWRIVATNFNEIDIKDIKYPLKFRVRNNIIVPYITLPFDDSTKLPIKRVVIGPSDTSEFTEESIRYYLKTNGYNDTEVVRSAIPYR
ncbi:DUF2971 domain-containing protein [Heyndrickxia acidicola]|uniref:DUF2971 domain-containing protein n=1 Tax=Heyndrickxia acidicola TaxID=209389 RepID=A0ABU6MI75_9BACI|nr:DUF2971 domain-containing protein [Heyndrickxia acidicola]MED1204215.1 DUF2971 domain-containing protein [Heyndrickxia acidicola]